MESPNTRKDHGFDEIPAKLLKHSAPIHYSHLIYDSIDMCSFPDMLKLGMASTQFKKIDNLIKKKKNNYRPVSKLIVLSKACERVMANQLLAYFEIILSPLLSSFRKKLRLPVYAVEYGTTFLKLYW